ncbi:MltR family transcriptional regulator [Thorsellia anophelis]|uniref:Mannitol operon repressor n=1 Tax=Thorsellia anophelis DSM 18579 TaxID=1123402 RepID=A0A1I0DS10_9GAMM|nr:MltR family transcriptional regulator [Thorsellia anophelis]SET35196.1 mannitol operon repressor [Thorsellia anophelis DSM 18579]
MTIDVDFENHILETLNSGKSVEEFLDHAVKFIAEVTTRLISKIFRKDDYAIRYAIDPLFGGNGPLSELGVKLKLLYALGIINRQEYEDTDHLLALYDEVMDKTSDLICTNHSNQSYQFTDEEVIAICHQLNCVEVKPVLFQNVHGKNDDIHDHNLLQMQQKRNRQVIKSTLVLSVSALISQLYKKPAEKISPLPQI